MRHILLGLGCLAICGSIEAQTSTANDDQDNTQVTIISSEEASDIPAELDKENPKGYSVTQPGTPEPMFMSNEMKNDLEEKKRLSELPLEQRRNIREPEVKKE